MTEAKPINWLDPFLLAQIAHWWIGFGVMLSLRFLVLPHEGAAGFLTLFFAFVGYTFLKEGWFDPSVEPNEPYFPEGMLDQAIYFCGAAVAGLLILWLAP